MDNRIGVISEVIILVFNILIFMRMTELEKDNRITRGIMHFGSALALGIFFFVTYTKLLPEAFASFACVTLPTFTLFFILSKYKDFRFFVTFCFLDTVTLIFTFFERAADMWFGHVVGTVAALLVCMLMCIVYLRGRRYFKQYRELMKNVDDGWGMLAASTFLIYLLLIFAASYPKPLVQRQEYLLVYAILCLAILSCYAVFILTLFQKKKLADLNAKFLEEQKWHRIAYNDALTGLKNRMAYIEVINQMERMLKDDDVIYAVMIDINDFKKINDTLGHHVGDLTLQNAANLFEQVFAEEEYLVFRIGGDEFAVISIDVAGEELEKRIAILHEESSAKKVGCSFSVGLARVECEQNQAIENAFIRADRAMYKEKNALKCI